MTRNNKLIGIAVGSLLAAAALAAAYSIYTTNKVLLLEYDGEEGQDFIEIEQD
ncbi:MAG: hypothetical protein RR543_05940 [Erysipelotrichales bacterium]